MPSEAWPFADPKIVAVITLFQASHWIRVLAAFGVALGVGSGLARADWPQWRGPQRDGTIAGFRPPQAWPAELRRAWSVPVGEGHASPIVVGERAFLLTRENDREVVRCVALADGGEAWRLENASDAELDGAVGRYGKSPRATPTHNDGRVFTLGAAGTLTAVDAKTGRKLWQHTFRGQFDRPYPEFGASASPLIVGDAVVVSIGGKDKGALAAFDSRTGQPKWTLADEGPSYASPVLLSLSGRRQIVTMTQSHVVGVSPSGERLWRLPFETEYRQNIVTPVALDGLLIFGGTNKPLQAWTFDANGRPSRAWENPDHSCYMSSPVLHDGLLFGMSQRSAGCLFCVDARTGRTRWKGPGRAGENVSVQRAGDVLVVLNDRGELAVARADGAAYKPLASYRVADSSVFSHPVLDGDRVLVKDERNLTLYLWK